MNPKQERLIIITILIGSIASAIFLFDLFTYKGRNIKEAKNYLKEYKTARALEILEKTRKRAGDKDKDVAVLAFYTYVKAKKYDLAEKALENIETVPKSFKEDFTETIELLNLYDKTNIIVKLLAKSQKLGLDQEFFIKVSQKKNSLQEELSVLETGLKYLRELKYRKSQKGKKIEIDTAKLEDYVLDRCIEIGEMYMGSKDYKKALVSLIKAQDLRVVDEGARRADYYYALAVTYRKLDDSQRAWDSLLLSAKLGSQRAQSLIEDWKEDEKKANK